MPTHAPLSYLTCTAAQADEYNAQHPHDFVSLNQLLEARADSHPNVVIAGFPERISDDGPWRMLSFTYSTLFSACKTTATFYVQNGILSPRNPNEKTDRIIALLSPSCADFLVTLFAALRLGYGILLLAPQNTPQAIKHLCTTTSVTHLLCQSALLPQARSARADNDEAFGIVEMAPRHIWYGKSAEITVLPLALAPEEEKNLTAVIMHTSGSTGMPKPIYHPHRIWTEAMPCIPGEPAFTTTPLYHGGSADLFRSMSALSTLYLFSSIYPVTTANVLGALSVCDRVSAFLSVPYILKLLAEDPDGVRMLRRMKLVSTGGAPLPEALGDSLVRQGVRLVSRLGSSECGFLMSSHRDYESDFEWSWLRNDGPGAKMLRFEPASDDEDVFELVVPREWSTRVVSNREDGTFATGDLYAKHPSIVHAWRYCGRVDDIVVMSNGKKASASPIETALRASPHITEAIVFGSSRPVLGVIIVPAAYATESDVRARVHAGNEDSASYTQIPDALVVVLAPDAELPRTSKGSVVRPKALVQYADVIEEAYERMESGSDNAGDAVALQDLTAEEIRQRVRGAVLDALRGRNGSPSTDACGHDLQVKDDDDLFAIGVDSVQAIVIRGVLQKLVGASGAVLASNVVFDHPSVARLTAHIANIKDGQTDIESTQEGQWTLMRELLDEYSTFACGQVTDVKVPDDSQGILLLTGATGALGAHVLAKILESKAMAAFEIVALVRAKDNIQAQQRVIESLQKRSLPTAGVTPGLATQGRVSALAADLTKGDLGLAENVFGELTARVTHVIHCAWPVNFAYNLQSFAPILQGTRNLINLALATTKNSRFIFCSSVATVMNDTALIGDDQTIPERLPISEVSAVPMGYAQAKWVAEHMCARACQERLLRGRVAIARVGQLCGDTMHGVWNESEGWPLLIASTRHTRCLPQIAENPCWLPVDIAAQTLVDLAMSDVAVWLYGSSEVPVYHIVNPERSTSWEDILEYLSRTGLSFERVSCANWINRLEAHEQSLEGTTKNLLPLWKSKYSKPESTHAEPKFDASHALQVCPSLTIAGPVTEGLVRKFYDSWRSSGFLPS